MQPSSRLEPLLSLEGRRGEVPRHYVNVILRFGRFVESSHRNMQGKTDLPRSNVEPRERTDNLWLPDTANVPTGMFTSRRSRTCLRWTITEPFGEARAMASPSARSPANSNIRVQHHPEDSQASRAQSPAGDAGIRPALGPFQTIIDQISIDDETALQAAAYRRSSVPADPRRTRLAVVGTPGATLVCGSTDAGIRKRSSRWVISRGNASKPISATSTSISLTVAGSCRSWSWPGRTRMLPSSWRSPLSVPKQSSKGWSRPSSSLEPCPRKSGGTTLEPSPR